MVVEDMKAIIKNNAREVRKTLGRYLAIGAIIMLGVGFFSGLSVTKQAMLDTADSYLRDNSMYDFKLLSTLGLRGEDIETLSSLDGVTAAEGVFTSDFIGEFEGEEFVFSASTMSEKINTPSLVAGRLPESSDECAVDSLKFSQDDIGKTISVSAKNNADTLDSFTESEYTIVGVVTSPLYLDRVRPTSKLGSGTISAFVIMSGEGMNSDFFTEAYITLEGDEYIHSAEYDEKIDRNTARIEETLSTLANGYYSDKYAEALGEINDAEGELSGKKSELDDARDELEKHKTELDDAEKAYHDGLDAIEEAKKELDENQKKLDDGMAEYEAGMEKYNAMVGAGYPVPDGTKEQLDLTYAALVSSQEQIDAGWDEIAREEKELSDAADEIEKGRAEIVDAEAEIADAEEKIRDAQSEIDDARNELDSFEKPDTYVLSRDSNVSYANLENNASIVSGIARVLPIFFFAVAALVCSTTMARMVSDGRTEIGTLKALGYGDSQIMLKYIGYSGSSALIGCLVGFFAGSWLFPMAIWAAYKMLYLFADRLVVVFSLRYLLISLAASLICSVGVTYVTVKNEMRECPANLIRPSAPSGGKKILLERIGFIWKRFRFIHKVSLRNIFRYKKRLIMMILGIGGCTALVLTGFGVNDSISDIVDLQYGEIMKYDLSLTLTDAADEKYKEDFRASYGSLLESYVFAGNVSAEAHTKNGVKSVSIISSDDPAIEKLIDIHTEKGEKIPYPSGSGAVVCKKLAEEAGYSVGDEIKINIGETDELSCVVAGICENYVNYMVYVSPEAFAKSGLDYPAEKVVYAKARGGSDIHETAAELMSADGAVNVSVTEDFRSMVSDMMTSMSSIVLLVILCAAALALVVLYNLTNINITERVREIATLKVLGFYPLEVSNYIFRENIVLTILGVIVGLPGGVLMHRFVMSQVNVDLVAFKIHILPPSYLYAAALTMIFTILVNLIMQRKLNKINMAESLKSVE